MLYNMFSGRLGTALYPSPLFLCFQHMWGHRISESSFSGSDMLFASDGKPSLRGRT